MLYLGLSFADWILVLQGALQLGQFGIQIAQSVSIYELMKKIVDGAWLLEQARKYGIGFDKTLISFADKIYDYFLQIVKGTLITPSVIDGFMDRVYIIVGIFIFFKIAMVAIKYIINPEQFLDDKFGAETLVKRVVLGAVIILIIPFIFETGTRLQGYIIQDRVIEKIILPGEAYARLVNNNVTGETLAMMVFRGFFNWNDAVPKDGTVYQSYQKVVKYDRISSFNDKDIVEQVNGEYCISYVPIISTLAVGYLLFMLLKYAMEAVFRSFKLVFLQLISPFVVVNYMLDTSKEEMMKKWTNATISTYIMLFLRVITIWFATLIAYYLKYGIPNAEGETSLLNEPDSLLKALIVLGLFAFLKDLPKIVSEIFGYDLQENETIGGIMNQGVNAVKGFALGKVGMDFQKKQMGWNIASSVVGGLGNIAGSIGNVAGMSSKAKAPSQGAVNFQAGTNAIVTPLQNTVTSLTAMSGSTISAMGSSVLAPLAQSATNQASYADRIRPVEKSYEYGKVEKEQKENNKNDKNPSVYVEGNKTLEEKIESNSKTDNSFVNDLKSQTNLQKYIEGDRINLSGVMNNSSHPVMEKMVEHIQSSISKDLNVSQDDIRKELLNSLYQNNEARINTNNMSNTDIVNLIQGARNNLEHSNSSISTNPSSESKTVVINNTINSTPTQHSSHEIGKSIKEE